MNKTTDDQARYVEDDVQDDAVIASAFRASLIVILLLGLPVIGVLVYLNIDKKQEVSTEVEVTTPDIREVNEEEIPVVAMTSVTKSSGIEFTHESGREGQNCSLRRWEVASRYLTTTATVTWS